jgi:hypothetical protein
MPIGNVTLVTAAALLVTTATLLGVLTLFWHAKRDVAALDSRVCGDRRDTVAAVELLRMSIRRLEIELAELRREQALNTPAQPVAAGGRSMNLQKRAQALRMHRRGDPLEKIAATLGIPSREVELLVKVQEVVRFGTGLSA